jgi:hypothetical protein
MTYEVLKWVLRKSFADLPFLLANPQLIIQISSTTKTINLSYKNQPGAELPHHPAHNLVSC